MGSSVEEQWEVIGDELPADSPEAVQARAQQFVYAQQFVLQPTFVKSDRKFNTEETIQSSRIAAGRSGNERAVRLCKTCNFLRNAEKGFKMKEVNRLCDVWLAHSFQINFMYKSVM